MTNIEETPIDAQIRTQVRAWSDKPTDADADKIQDDYFDAGERVVWMYRDDLEWLNSEACGLPHKVTEKNWRRHANYGGIVVPLSDVESHRSFDGYAMLNDVMICGLTYPTEKSYPESEWFSLGQLICDPDLVWFGKEE